MRTCLLSASRSGVTIETVTAAPNKLPPPVTLVGYWHMSMYRSLRAVPHAHSGGALPRGCTRRYLAGRNETVHTAYA